MHTSISCGCILHRHVLRGRKCSRCSAAFWPRSPRRQTYAKRRPTSAHAFCVLQTTLPPPLAKGLRVYEPDNSSFAEHARNEARCVRVKFCRKSQPAILPASGRPRRFRRCGRPHSSTSSRGSGHWISWPKWTPGAAASSPTRRLPGPATTTGAAPSPPRPPPSR